MWWLPKVTVSAKGQRYLHLPLHPSISPSVLQFTPQLSMATHCIDLWFRALSLDFHAAISTSPDNRPFSYLDSGWTQETCVSEHYSNLKWTAAAWGHCFSVTLPCHGTAGFYTDTHTLRTSILTHFCPIWFHPFGYTLPLSAINQTIWEDVQL